MTRTEDLWIEEGLIQTDSDFEGVCVWGGDVSCGLSKKPATLMLPAGKTHCA